TAHAGRSLQRPTASFRVRARGSWRMPRAQATPERLPACLPSSARCSTLAGASPTSCVRSCPPQQNGSTSRSLTSTCKRAAFCSRRWRRLRSGYCEVQMERVTGIGGIFFKAKDPKTMQAWYQRHLGINVQDWGGAVFQWTDADGNPVGGTTIWSIGSADGDSFAPSSASFMVNYRVADVGALLGALREDGCNVLDQLEETECGQLSAVIDAAGSKCE